MRYCEPGDKLYINYIRKIKEQGFHVHDRVDDYSTH